MFLAIPRRTPPHSAGSGTRKHMHSQSLADMLSPAFLRSAARPAAAHPCRSSRLPLTVAAAQPKRRAAAAAAAAPPPPVEHANGGATSSAAAVASPPASAVKTDYFAPVGLERELAENGEPYSPTC